MESSLCNFCSQNLHFYSFYISNPKGMKKSKIFSRDLQSSKFNKGRTIIPLPPGGIAIMKKIVCMRKNAKINCLPQRCIWKKLFAETTYVMQDLGNLKKLFAHPGWRKKLAYAQSMVEKNFLLEITIPPRGK